MQPDDAGRPRAPRTGTVTDTRTSPRTLDPQYDPAAFEPGLYREWLERGLFARSPGSGRSPFTMVIPPPNVTAVLHMGHGLNNTVQDVIVRFERMRGRDALWVPGTDHAGIATQNVVEKLLAREGRTRFDLGREAFVERTGQFVAETGGVILEQLKAIGCSCDWSLTAYTLSPQLSRAVREAFVRLWEDDLIYRGHRVIHWCPRCHTALSDEEAEHSETDGKLYHIRYPLQDGSGYATVATTRPETLLGDVAVAVNPSDASKAALVGRMVILPIVELPIPVIADESVEQDFGSGFLKITPAHDPNDFEVGRRHGLEMPVVIDAEGTMADASREGRAGGRVPEGIFGLDRFAARRVVLERLEAAGLIAKTEPHRHGVRRCYRCDTVVEPRLSDQWFVRMRPLAEPALAAYRDGSVRFLPERRGEEYARWLENIRDWNISRQLWWGHRIPVWYCDSCGTMKAYREDPRACGECGGALRQDEDVLDTWFSSWLWPFSTLGWPDETPELRRYYPGDVLVTAPEILFFWVARMVFAGLRFMGAVPFHTVYLHGTVRDMQHRKMSKSLGNGIDPLDVVQRYGADALRFTVINGLAVGTDILMDPTDLETTFAPGRNFANKLWNAGRLVLLNCEGRAVAPLATLEPAAFRLADRWILSRLDRCIAECTTHMEKFRLNDAVGAPYHFLWDDFADWYLEAIKPRLYGEEPGADAALAVAVHCFETVLRLLHPVMPFITEALRSRLPGVAGSIVTAQWPAPAGRSDGPAEAAFDFTREVVNAARAARAEYRVPPGQVVEASLSGLSGAGRQALEAERGMVMRLARLSRLEEAEPAGAGAYQVLPGGATLFVALKGAIDLAKECARIGSERERLSRQLEVLRAKLANPSFTGRAPADVVALEREKETGWREKLAALEAKLKALGC
jgi:valyl-tRNA synthetase